MSDISELTRGRARTAVYISSRIDLTTWWIVGFVLLIAPLKIAQNYEQHIADLQWKESWLRARFMDCVDAENPQRLYFQSGNYVEFKCITYKDTTLRYHRTKAR